MLIPFHDATDRNVVGGKAAALGKLIRAGFEVPRGFVLPAAASDKDIEESKDDILQVFDELDCPLVAVRSSAIAEDGEQSTWAGQFETFINVDRSKLMERISQCRASANSANVHSYAKLRDLDNSQMSVIVQAMVQSEVSGISFSVHPVTHAANEIVIEAGLGLGEAIVSGEITPDNYVLDKRDARLITQAVSSQTKRLALNDTTMLNSWQTITPPADKPKLNPAQLTSLTNLTAELETFFDFPVDIEWAWADKRFYVLQCRPITALD